MPQEPNPLAAPVPTPALTPAPTPEPAPAPAPPAVSTIVPKEFHDRPYLKDLLEKPLDATAYEAIFKKLDGAERLVGKKGVPEPTAPAEEWEAFFAKMRPESPEKYELPAPGEGADQDFLKALRESFHASGLSPIQAKRMYENLEKVVSARSEAAIAAAKKADEEFTTLVKTTFGSDGEGKKALETARGMLEEFTPEPLRQHLPKLSNEALTILTAVLTGVHKKYGVEDKGVDGSGRGATSDSTSLREEGRRLMSLPEYKDFTHPKHDAVVNRVSQIYAELGKMGK